VKICRAILSWKLINELTFCLFDFYMNLSHRNIIITSLLFVHLNFGRSRGWQFFGGVKNFFCMDGKGGNNFSGVRTPPPRKSAPLQEIFRRARGL
jgi:hypothetical protein